MSLSPIPLHARSHAARLWSKFVHHFEQVPTFWGAMIPHLVLSALLFTRSLATNFIFDEQEALLANPFVNGRALPLWEVVHRDFWGLPVERSVGSYRPLPDLIWRLLASAMREIHWVVSRVIHLPPFGLSPWAFHWCNVLLHAVNASLLSCWVYAVSRRRDAAWLSGILFVCAAVLTEAVSGVVGTADVLGGLGAILGLCALLRGMPLMVLGVAGATWLGLFSKESALVAVPLLPFTALVLAHRTHPANPRRWTRSALCAASTTAAFVLYVHLRKGWFPSALPPELAAPLPDSAGPLARSARAFLTWFHQPTLPKDPLNNPFVSGDFAHRVAGALRVYSRGLTQLVYPVPLSGDYSFPQEPLPTRVVFPESILGALFMVGPLLLSAAILIHLARARVKAVGSTALARWAIASSTVTSSLVAWALTWTVVAYFPLSNIPVALPTVRAERFWYLPALATSVLLALGFSSLLRAASHPANRLGRTVTIVLLAGFLTFQCGAARLHALDYADDLTFWGATRLAVPNSAKAHLNYSVMWGARGQLDTRLEENEIAARLAPEWPMAHVYLGDTLCHLHRPQAAWAPFERGFRLGPNDPNLIALALQCLWEEGAAEGRRDELLALADAFPGTWLEYLAKDLVYNGKEHAGVDPKYRPRAYNEGPKE